MWLNVVGLAPIGKFIHFSPQAFFKVCESLSFIVRSDHLITPDNFSACVRCTRHFAEIASSKAALDYDKLHTKPTKSPGSRREKASSPTRLDRPVKGEGGVVKMGGARGDSNTTYASALLQLLDLLDALYSKVRGIFDGKELACPEVEGCPEVGEGVLMWNTAWCPLLQGNLLSAI